MSPDALYLIEYSGLLCLDNSSVSAVRRGLFLTVSLTLSMLKPGAAWPQLCLRVLARWLHTHGPDDGTCHNVSNIVTCPIIRALNMHPSGECLKHSWDHATPGFSIDSQKPTSSLPGTGWHSPHAVWFQLARALKPVLADHLAAMPHGERLLRASATASPSRLAHSADRHIACFTYGRSHHSSQELSRCDARAGSAALAQRS
jgi:hypothetical protein